jgi:hypothetical protein
MTASGIQRRVVSLEQTVISEVRTTSIIRAMETTRRCFPKGSHFHTLRRENLKSHTRVFYQFRYVFFLTKRIKCKHKWNESV